MVSERMRDGRRREDGRVVENIVPNDEQMRLSDVSGDEDNVSKNVDDDEACAYASHVIKH